MKHDPNGVSLDEYRKQRYAGCYHGTDQPLTSEDGIALSPRGHMMWPTIKCKSPGYAYFIQHETGGFIKIGCSHDPEYRCADINKNTHDPRYHVLLSVPGGKDAENNLHIKFRHLRMHAEWFRPEQDLLDFIAGTDAES